MAAPLFAAGPNTNITEFYMYCLDMEVRFPFHGPAPKGTDPRAHSPRAQASRPRAQRPGTSAQVLGPSSGRTAQDPGPRVHKKLWLNQTHNGLGVGHGIGRGLGHGPHMVLAMALAMAVGLALAVAVMGQDYADFPCSP